MGTAPLPATRLAISSQPDRCQSIASDDNIGSGGPPEGINSQGQQLGPVSEVPRPYEGLDRAASLAGGSQRLGVQGREHKIFSDGPTFLPLRFFVQIDMRNRRPLVQLIKVKRISSRILPVP